ncbi:MAG: 16S rRNA (uracil(1498)-N(3))-methyltransferase [Rhodothalassiaceae bacterium]
MTARAPLRLHCESRLGAGAIVALPPENAHYLLHVMRRQPGDAVLLFNAEDGEWRATLLKGSKREASVKIEAQLRAPMAASGPVLLFAPIRRSLSELVVEKATELGASAIRPVLTARTQGDRLRPDRLRAIAREAAEQCGRLDIPTLLPSASLAAALAEWPASRPLYFCDERREAPGLLATACAAPAGPAGLLIGPEGGFSPEEATLLSGMSFVRAVRLGPLVLRAETAAIAALTILRAVEEQRPAGLQ